MSKLPYFSRSQLGIAILLGAALILVWAWRADFFRPPSTAPAQDLELVFVEVAGAAAAQPGIFKFDHPPTLAEVWKRGGVSAPPPADGSRLASGTRLEVAKDGKYRLGRMAGERLLTLGLALDLNSATAADLEALPGIGPALAKRIVGYRTDHGPFKNIEDLQQVSGIGPGNLERLKPHLVLGSPEESAASPEAQGAVAPGSPGKAASLEPRQGQPRPGSRHGKPGAKPTKAPARAVNPNLASQADLETLPGIGPVLAKRIIDYRRSHGPFKKIADLELVSGIGPKKLEKMKPYLTVSRKAETVNERR